MLFSHYKMSSEELISLASADYKQAKELFAINVKGCSFGDILSTLLLVPLFCIVYQELCTLLFKVPVLSLPVNFTCSCILGAQNGSFR